MEEESNARGTPAVAYFSMEVGFESGIPTYSGGLGVLAGDTLKAAADLSLPVSGVSLIHRKGYFRQSLGARGAQRELPDEWNPADHLEAVPETVSITLESRNVVIRAWRRSIGREGGGRIWLYLLDTALPENAPEDRKLTDQLYGGDRRYRLMQESVLGIGGVMLLRALGHDLRVCHMNEGHSALLALALLESTTADGLSQEEAIEEVRRHCVFTTHTPVPAGHDVFPIALVEQVLGSERTERLRTFGCLQGEALNMTHLGLHLSRYVNGVAMRHQQVSALMFPDYRIRSITNGIHAPTWAAPSFAELFDRRIPEWRTDRFNLRYAIAIPRAEIRAAHQRAKADFIEEVQSRAGVTLDPDAFTIGFARRATAYKRATLLFTDPDRLRRITREVGPLQIVFAGKAHPQDEGGKAMIKRIFAVARALRQDVNIVYLENYDMRLGGLMTAGVDLWLNTPQKPQEASGTSGMKAALNGVPSLSVLDGWWIEGHVEGATGWSIGDGWQTESDSGAEAESLYAKLESRILPLYYEQPDEFARVMRSAIALNGSFFNAQRMMLQYAAEAYGLGHAIVSAP
ncbi:MAG TPA: alpha-glucan family phosphorylase [Longimicrobiales bacterium]|nr:alpha-glucan family phosphorylase [Longimicrobiales bacterium]